MDHPAPSPEQNAIEAAAFRRLLEHLDSHRDVQNIDLMNLAGFCRNCLSRWYREAAEAALPEIKERVANVYRSIDDNTSR